MCDASSDVMQRNRCYLHRKPLTVFPTWHTSPNGGHTLPEHWTETGFGGGHAYITGGIDTWGEIYWFYY